MKQDTIRQKHEKRCNWSASAHVYMRRNIPFLLYAPVKILDEPPSISPVAYIPNGWPVSQPKINKNIRISYSLKYEHSKKTFFTNKINVSIG